MEPYDAASASERARELRASLSARRDVEAMLAEASATREAAVAHADAIIVEAQQLSDQLLREIRAEAERISLEARQHAESIVALARAEAEDITREARAAAEGVRARAEAQIDEHRKRVRAELTEQVTREVADQSRREFTKIHEQQQGMIGDLEASVRILGVSLEAAVANITEMLAALDSLRTHSSESLGEMPMSGRLGWQPGGSGERPAGPVSVSTQAPPRAPAPAPAPVQAPTTAPAQAPTQVSAAMADPGDFAPNHQQIASGHPAVEQRRADEVAEETAGVSAEMYTQMPAESAIHDPRDEAAATPAEVSVDRWAPEAPRTVHLLDVLADLDHGLGRSGKPAIQAAGDDGDPPRTATEAYLRSSRLEHEDPPLPAVDDTAVGARYALDGMRGAERIRARIEEAAAAPTEPMAGSASEDAGAVDADAEARNGAAAAEAAQTGKPLGWLFRS